MFQNINVEIEDTEEDIKTYKPSKIELLKENFKIQNIILYILAFGVSKIGFGDTIAPFAMAFLAAVCSNKKTVGLIWLILGLGTFMRNRRGRITYIHINKSCFYHIFTNI